MPKVLDILFLKGAIEHCEVVDTDDILTLLHIMWYKSDNGGFRVILMISVEQILRSFGNGIVSLSCTTRLLASSKLPSFESHLSLEISLIHGCDSSSIIIGYRVEKQEITPLIFKGICRLCSGTNMEWVAILGLGARCLGQSSTLIPLAHNWLGLIKVVFNSSPT